MELQTDVQKKVNQEIAGTTKTGAEIAGKLAEGVLKMFEIPIQEFKDDSTRYVSRKVFGIRNRMH